MLYKVGRRWTTRGGQLGNLVVHLCKSYGYWLKHNRDKGQYGQTGN